MEKGQIIIWTAVVIILFGMFSFLMPEVEKNPTNNMLFVREKQVKQAVYSALAAIDCGYTDVGYDYVTATDAVERYLQYANAEITPTPEEEEMYGSDVFSKKLPIMYAKGKPTGSWQVSLFPDDEKKKIRIIGYGTDINRSVESADVFCD